MRICSLLNCNQNIGKYTIIRCLGTGGFGSVYLADDSLLNRKVAIKIPHYQITEKDEILLEPRIMASLKHPNIVELLTIEKFDNKYLMIMEYIAGESLDKLIRRKQSLTISESLDIAINICMAIEFAHMNQVVHRDLRPANIIINDKNIAKVTDFGTSVYLEKYNSEYSNQQSKQIFNMSTFRNDLWSIGAILYEMLTGTIAINYNDKNTAFSKLQSVIPPHIKLKTIPKFLSETIMDIISVQPKACHLSAGELLKVLQNFRKQISTNKVIIKTNLNSIESPTMISKLIYKFNSNPKEHICRFCYRPLPRLATYCPICGEAVGD